MIKMRYQIRDFFKYKKQIEELVQGIQSDLLRVTKKNKEAQKYLNIVNLTNQNMKKYLQKVTN